MFIWALTSATGFLFGWGITLIAIVIYGLLVGQNAGTSLSVFSGILFGTIVWIFQFFALNIHKQKSVASKLFFLNTIGWGLVGAIFLEIRIEARGFGVAYPFPEEITLAGMDIYTRNGWAVAFLLGAVYGVLTGIVIDWLKSRAYRREVNS
jgi:hypothetical protein